MALSVQQLHQQATDSRTKYREASARLAEIVGHERRLQTQKPIEEEAAIKRLIDETPSLSYTRAKSLAEGDSVYFAHMELMAKNLINKTLTEAEVKSAQMEFWHVLALLQLCEPRTVIPSWEIETNG